MARIAAAVLGAALGAWWLVGDLSFETDDRLDFWFRAPEIPLVVEVAVGVLGVAAVVWAVATAGERWRPVLLLACCGAVLGFGGRVVTAGVIGANIGGATFVLLVLPPTVLVAVIAGARFLR